MPTDYLRLCDFLKIFDLCHFRSIQVPCECIKSIIPLDFVNIVMLLGFSWEHCVVFVTVAHIALTKTTPRRFIAVVITLEKVPLLGPPRRGEQATFAPRAEVPSARCTPDTTGQIPPRHSVRSILAPVYRFFLFTSFVSVFASDCHVKNNIMAMYLNTFPVYRYVSISSRSQSVNVGIKNIMTDNLAVY